MSKFKAMKFWIGDDLKCSERVQRMLFEMGYDWAYEPCKGVPSHTFSSSLGVDERGRIFWMSSVEFERKASCEINIDWLRTPKEEETIELGGKTYIKTELEEALKHIKPIEETK